MRVNSAVLRRFLVASAVALALPLPAFAQSRPDRGPAPRCDGAPGPGHFREGPGERPMHGEGPMPGFLHGLDLNEGQRDKVFAIGHDQAPQLREKFKAVQKAKEDLRALVTSPQYDEAKAKSLADTEARAMAEIALLRARSEHAIYALLTPEQRKKAEELKAKRGTQPPVEGPDRPGPRR
ncbi:MAG: Spy/CpxP family protein refolding chaperone [Rhodocyclaceae bacterium]